MIDKKPYEHCPLSPREIRLIEAMERGQARRRREARRKREQRVCYLYAWWTVITAAAILGTIYIFAIIYQ